MITNKDAIEILSQTFPDLASDYWKEYPDIKYSKEYVVKNIENFIDKIGHPTLCEINASLTIRQTYLAAQVFDLCKANNIGDAIHQLIDTIDNFNEVYVYERPITHIEHLLYYGMANAILLAIR